MRQTGDAKTFPRAALVALSAVAAFAMTLTAQQLLGDGDTWWHVTVGQWILEHGQPPRADHWSLTKLGTPWTAHEWLSELLLAAVFRLAGWAGVTVLAACAFSLTAWILGWRLSRDLGGVALAALLIISLSLMTPNLLARPHLLALPVLAGWAVGLLRARDRGTAPTLWLAPLMTLWANLHGGYALGLALIGPFALEALIEAPAGGRLKVVRDWGLFGLAALACAAVTPFGVEGLLQPLKFLTMNTAAVTEWRPTDFSHVGPLEIALLAGLGFALLRPVTAPPLRVLMVIGLAHMAISHARHQVLLGVLAPMLLAEPVARAIGAAAVEPGRRAFPKLAVAAAVLGAAVLGAVRLAVPLARHDSLMAPISAVAAVPAQVRATPVLNDYAFGGYLIAQGVRPFIDGRNEVYGDAFMDRYLKITSPDPKALDAALAEYKVGWTILSPGQPAVALMDARPGWRRIYADKFAVVHVKGR